MTDQVGLQSSDSVNVTVVANQAPIADAGGDVTVTDNDGSGSEAVCTNPLLCLFGLGLAWDPDFDM